MATTDPTVRAALYARVSSEEQAQEGYSLEGQVERLKAYAASRAWQIAGIFIDAGMTARDTKREAYQKAMSQLKDWDAFVVMKMDRVHRNSRNFLDMMATFAKEGKEFVSMTESLDTGTAMGRFVMSILSQIAQLESEQIGERTSFGLRTKAKTGDYALGQRAAFGYEWTKGDAKKGTGEWRVVPDEAKIVRQIFEWTGKGKGVPTISQDLKWCKCKPRQVIRTYQKKDGTMARYLYRENRWDCAGCFRVRYILNNPAYVGYLVYGGQILPGSHKALVDRKTFEKAQSKRYRTRVILPTA